MFDFLSKDFFVLDYQIYYSKAGVGRGLRSQNLLFIMYIVLFSSCQFDRIEEQFFEGLFVGLVQN